ncbi:MAG: phosphoribosylformylglycinamidine synthase subunit PurQ, partial [Pirellulaceae bacterium]|nr:phosphoribosylformylglycinamidine synthase subunit PurQ [Pirellulaceae bacterium]
CNGFQILIKSGLLLDQRGRESLSGAKKSPETDREREPLATLTWNDSGQYEDRWARVGTHGSKCVFLKDIDEMYLPVAHAEGKFVARDEAALEQLDAAGQLVLRYLPLDAPARSTAPERVGRLGVLKKSGASTPSDANRRLPFPDNPNGSMGNVAGVCDATGRVLGLMPHPERHITRTQHPRWTRPETTRTGDGLKMFENAVAYFA